GLLVFEPVAAKLIPSIVELARTLPRPLSLLSVRNPMGHDFANTAVAHLDSLLADVPRIEWQSCRQTVEAALQSPLRLKLDGEPREHDTIELVSAEREIETEDVVLSLGPVQPFTAGPLRIWLVCDGEQISDARVESGYARRDIEGAMRAASWGELPAIAAQLDPLAPACGRLACVRALESLAGAQPGRDVERWREAALAIERATSHCFWLTRFARLLGVAPLADRALGLASSIEATDLWRPPASWIAEHHVPADVLTQSAREATVFLRSGADRLGALQRRVERDRLLDLRIRGIGILDAQRVARTEITGPVREACERRDGDVKSRMLARMSGAQRDLTRTAGLLEAAPPPASAPSALRPPGRGRARTSVDGPRGRIDLVLESRDGGGPATVEWHRPSAALLAILPELLRGQKLVDAEAILASLDLSMAEADG
ncbi:MAG TPA: hypothetical protein VJ722_11555, partial [Rhodanobacteraceae bacterium]|nr:hypothetical protein [Rhodanobacteraceae bacterium]